MLMKQKYFILIIVVVLMTSCFIMGKFKWTSENVNKMTELGLNKEDVIILASIVEKETYLNDEKPKIARVYINRLKNDMLLQADPTILFAWNDSTIKRIQKKHLEIDSPYNTYKYKGLPPGLICKPSKETILAVLNADNNNYLYFCAKPDFSGHFNYASTGKEQLANTKQYLDALNKLKINQNE